MQSKTSSGSHVSLDSDLEDLLRNVFPGHHKEYAAMLVDHDLMTCESLGEMSVDDLIEVGFKKPTAKRLLHHCCSVRVALSVDHVSQVVGYIRSSPLALLLRVREIIEEAQVPGVPLSFSFTYRDCPLTLQQERSWKLKQILTENDGIVVIGTCTADGKRSQIV